MDGSITVFGGSGFIGRHLVPLLLRSGAAVRVAVRDRRRAQVTTKSDQAVEYIQADLLNHVAVGTAIREPMRSLTSSAFLLRRPHRPIAPLTSKALAA